MLSRNWLIGAGALALLVWTGLAAALPVPRGQLPDSVRPLAYRIALTVDPSRRLFYGRVDIDIQVTQPTQTLYMDALGLRMGEVEVETTSTTGVPAFAQVTQVDPSGVIRLDFPPILQPGRATLRFDYSAPFQRVPQGLFRAKVGRDWYAWTQMEPIDARRVFPCFDDPEFKTPFTISVTAPASAKVFANTPQVWSRRTWWYHRIVHGFATTKPLPTYLVAIAVGPFDVIQTTVPPNAVRSRPLPFRVIATRGQKARMQVIATEGPKLLGLLERYLGMAYPYQKLDLAASPVQSGAMENAGLILFQDSEILLDPHPRPSQLSELGIVTAHEMAHQWFGDLVTPVWWTDIWLNESFAEWMGVKVASEWRPDLDIRASELVHAFAAMDTDALGHDRPIRQEITNSSQIEGTFDDITYLKGAQVLSMIESFLGPGKLQQAVRQYLRAHAWGHVTTEDFLQSLRAAGGNPQVVSVLRTFIDQPGVPVVTLRGEPDGLSLSQARYHPLGITPASPEVWSIPVCVRRGQTRSCTVLQKATATVAPIPGDGALVPNADGMGYYRFRLDDAGWNRLVAIAGQLPAREAMAVGDSLWSDFIAGTGSFARILTGARELSEQSEPMAATELAWPLEELSRSMLAPDELPGYARVMDSIYGLKLAELGLDVRRGAYAAEPSGTRLLRQSLVSLVAVQGRDRPVRLKLANAAQASLDGAPGALDAAFRRAAFSVAVQDRGVPFMTQLKKALIKSSDPSFRADVTAALGAADTPELAAAALQMATSSGLRPPETLRIIESLTLQPGARSLAIDYINSHFNRVLQWTSGFDRPELIDVLFGEDCAAGDVARMDAWATRWLNAVGGTDLDLARVKESIQQCVALKQAKGDEIAAALGAPLAAAPRQSFASGN